MKSDGVITENWNSAYSLDYPKCIHGKVLLDDHENVK